jgi:hypothetical protein
VTCSADQWISAIAANGAETCSAPSSNFARLATAQTWSAMQTFGTQASLDAADVVSGTLADARLSSNVDLLNGAQTVTGAKTFNSGTLSFRNSGNTQSGTLATSASAARTYTFPDATGTVPLLGLAQSWTALQTFGTQASLDASDIVSGTLGVARGGTGASSLTAHGVLVGEGTAAVAATATGSSGQILQSNGAADPTFVSTLSTGVSLQQSSQSTVTTGAVSLTSASTQCFYATGFPTPSITVPANAKVFLSGDIGVAGGSATTATIDIALIQDGALLSDGGYQRVYVNNAAPNAIQYASFSQTVAPAAGTHTYGICGAWVSGGTPNTFGGDTNSVLQGELTVTILRQ